MGLTNFSRIFVTLNILFYPLKTLKSLQTPASKHLTPVHLCPTGCSYTPEDTHVSIQYPQNVSTCDQASLSTHENPKGHLRRKTDPLINPFQVFISFFNVDILYYKFEFLFPLCSLFGHYLCL